jgi:glutathione S-transferase
LEQSRSQRIVWLLQECKGIDLEIKIYKRVNMLAPPELKKIHPLGKSPIVTVQAPGAAEPIVFAETGAIIEYLTEYFAPHLIPKRFSEGTEPRVGGETRSWLRYRHLMHYAEGSLMSLLVLALVMDRMYHTLPQSRRPTFA